MGMSDCWMEDCHLYRNTVHLVRDLFWKGIIMNKHTPGPWKIAEGIDGHGNITIFSLSDAEKTPATVYGDTIEQQDANAKLIAAAPDLLEACQKMSDLLGIGKDYGRDLKQEHEAWLASKRAIMKATYHE